MIVIRHVCCFEDLGASPMYSTNAVPDSPTSMLGSTTGPAGCDHPALLVILGGPIGVANDETDYPFLRDGSALLERQRLVADSRPRYLSRCPVDRSGHWAVGYPGSAKEIGWQPLELTAAGRTRRCATWTAGSPACCTGMATPSTCRPGRPARLHAALPSPGLHLGRATLAFAMPPEACSPVRTLADRPRAAELTAAGLSLPDLRRDSATHGATSRPRDDVALPTGWLASDCEDAIEGACWAAADRTDAVVRPNGEPSAIDKRTVDQNLWLGRTGFADDQQGDPRHHGGTEKAVHHYPAEHYADWRRELPATAQ